MMQQAKIPVPMLKSWCNIENAQMLLCVSSQHLMQGKAPVIFSGAGEEKGDGSRLRNLTKMHTESPSVS